MKKFKSCIALLLSLILVLGTTSQAFAAYTGTYGLYVPVSNSSTLWVGNNGTSNENQLLTSTMSGYKVYKSSDGQYAYYNDTIYVNPGDIRLAISVAKRLDNSNSTFDTRISNPQYWTYTTMTGDCNATVSSYSYNNSSMFPGTWYTVNIKGMEIGDRVKITTNYMTGYIVCGAFTD